MEPGFRRGDERIGGKTAVNSRRQRRVDREPSHQRDPRQEAVELNSAISATAEALGILATHARIPVHAVLAFLALHGLIVLGLSFGFLKLIVCGTLWRKAIEYFLKAHLCSAICCARIALTGKTA
jgi:hypothetical protein